MLTDFRKISNTQQELQVEIPSIDFEVHVDKAAEKLSQNFKIQGFRKGHVPKHIVELELGSSRLYSEAAEIAVQATYSKALQESRASSGLQGVGEDADTNSRVFFDSLPRQAISEVQVTKLAPKNPFMYKIVFIVPFLELLRDYRGVAHKVREKEKESSAERMRVEEKEVDDALMWLAKNRQSRSTRRQSSGDNVKRGDDHIELDDNFARSLGNFQGLEDLKKSIKEGIALEKENKEKDYIRLKIVKEIIRQSKSEVPEKVIAAEVSRMEGEFKQRITQMGLDFDEYLKKIQKKREELHQGWRDQAKERVEVLLAIDAIAKKEGMKLAEEEVRTEAQKVLNQYKKTEDAQKDIDPDRLHEYVCDILKREKVFEFLESQ